MKVCVSLVIFLLSLASWGQTDPCNRDNVLALLFGNETNFYSRKQANDCLIKATTGGVPNIVATTDAASGLTKFTSPGIPLARYLKQDKRDFFISQNIIGQYKVKERNAQGNLVGAGDKFKPKACELTKQTCEDQNKNLNKDYCTCEDKETLYCGTKKWHFEKYQDHKTKCETKEESSWDDSSCECSDIKYCGEKKWSKKKKERETEICLGKKGFEWDDKACSCVEKLYCGEKKWNIAKLDKETKQCEKDDKYTWNPITCSCDINEKTTHMCNGKLYDIAKYRSEESACLARNSADKPHLRFEWDEEKCRCDKEKIEHVCKDGESISQKKYDSKHARCLEKIAHDDRYYWDEEKCDCDKRPREKLISLCGGKNWSQNKVDRKKEHCAKIKGTWDEVSCECEDPCYEVEERREEDTYPCTDIELKLGDVSVDDMQAKVCEKALPDADKEKIKDQCKAAIEALYKASPSKTDGQKFVAKIPYTSSEQVLCSENLIIVNREHDITAPLPANVPTTDLSKFTGDCASKQGQHLVGDLNKYRPYGKITCAQMENLKKANQDIKDIANNTLAEFLKDMKVQDKISADEMNQLLNKSKITMDVIGTANRSNNGTGITLDALAKERKVQAEMVMKEQILEKLKDYVTDPNYTVPNPQSIFGESGISQAVGPLNPASSVDSMIGVLKEAETPEKLKECIGKGGRDAKKLYDCSVDYFIDTECPSLAKKLHDKFCQGDLEAKRAELKAQKTGAFLEDFKMFQVGVNLSSDIKQPVYGEVGTIEVNCASEIKSEEVTTTETTITDYLKVTKPGFFRRLKKDCREERKRLNEEYGRRNVRRAANERKNPTGIAIEE